MNRLDRITAILIHLQSRRIVKASDLSERFGISLRTVYRDIRSLETAGIPIISEAGIGYSLIDGYRLPPVMFTQEEAAALLLSEKLMSKLTDEISGEQHSSAMYKIRSVLLAADKEHLEVLEEKVKVLQNPYLPSQIQDNKIGVLTKAISDKKLVEIEYFSNHRLQDTDRTVEPIGLWFLSGRWNLTAWCQLRKDYRHFRLDRIKQIVKVHGKFSQKHPALNKLIDNVAKVEGLIKVVLDIDKTAYKYIGDQKYYQGFVSQTDIGDKVRMEFLSGSLMGISRWFIMIGDAAEIIEPEALKTEVQCLIDKINAKMKGC